jgi:uncharacterized membrane protein
VTGEDASEAVGPSVSHRVSQVFWREQKLQWHAIVLLALVVCGATLRLWNLGGPSFWNDEGASSLLALQVSKYGLPLAPGSLSAYKVVNYAPLYPEIEGIFFVLFGVSQAVARLPSALLGTLMIPTAYLLGRRLSSDRATALLFAGLTTFSTEYIAWSRQARQYVLYTLLLMVAALLVARFVEARTTRSRASNGILLGLCAGALLLADPALSLLYLPGFVLALAVFYLLSQREALRRVRTRWRAWRESLREFRFTRAARPGWYAVLVLGGLVAVAAYLSLRPSAAVRLFEAVTGSHPYPFLFVPTYFEYLGTYYSVLATLAVIGAVYSCVPVHRGALAVLAFILGCLFSLSTLISLIVNVTTGGPPFERYLTPVIVFILYFAAVAIVAVVRAVLARTPARVERVVNPRRASSRHTAVLASGTIVVTVALLMIAPTGLTTYTAANDSQFNSTVPWAPLSFDPAFPSALYRDFQPNYQLASRYVAAHRAPGDVVAASWADAPTFYIGKINYVFATNPPAGFTVYVNGTPEYFLTGSVILSNISAVESLMLNASGWFIEDTVSGAGLTGPTISLGAHLLMTTVGAGSDPSVTLFHWNRTTYPGMLEALYSQRVDLQALFGGNFTRLVDWAATIGVTVPLEGVRPILLPMEPYLVGAVTNATRPLAVLISVFNARYDLQLSFNQTFYGNDTPLIRWAAQVVTGQIVDSAYSTLEPYAAWYVANQ